MAQAGPRAAVPLHAPADEVLMSLAPTMTMVSNGTRELQDYVALARTFEPKDAPWLENHRGHLMFVKPEERPFVTAEADRQHDLHRNRGRDLRPHRGDARRGLHPVHHPAGPRPGGRADRLGADPQGVRLRKRAIVSFRREIESPSSQTRCRAVRGKTSETTPKA
jgi:hypothetical protein